MLASAAYHPPPPTLSFTWDPLPVVGLGAALCVYAWGLGRLWCAAGVGRGVRVARASCFGLGAFTALAALVSPLDQLSDGLFAAHMTQHELLMVVAAPLVVLGRPFTVLVWALPLGARAFCCGIVPAFIVVPAHVFATA